MFGAFAQPSPYVAKARAFADVSFASIEAAVEFFTARGDYAEPDSDHPGFADVFTAQGEVLTIEPLEAR